MNLPTWRGLAVAAALALTACGGAPAAQPPAIMTKVQDVASFTAAGNDFGFRLLDQLLGTTGDNFLLSPLSASLALSMANEGAKGATRTAIERTLGVEGQARDAADRLLASLADPGAGVQVDVASSAWSERTFALRPEYVETMKTAYRAQATALDFTSPRAPAQINAWVKEHTDGKIDSIVDRIPAAVVLYLINALYFHADWATQFNRALTRPQPFTTAGGAQLQVPMMNDSAQFAYWEQDGVQAVALPYRGNRFRMVVALPGTVWTPERFRALVTPDWWQRLNSGLTSRQGSVSLPRFTLDWHADLVRSLSQLGMGAAFGPNADLSGISNACGCHISSVLQKTHIEVDEQGTTAAAATAVGVAASATISREPFFTMVVDRPFLLGLVDGATGALLFLGVIGNPTAG